MTVYVCNSTSTILILSFIGLLLNSVTKRAVSTLQQTCLFYRTAAMPEKKQTTDLLNHLRVLMRDKTHVPELLDAYIIPTADEHNSEYVGPADRRRAFISGFTGSDGTAVVTQDKALMWTDGRYYLQSSQQMDQNWTLMKEGLPETPSRGKELFRGPNL